ncbi:hypothetical protein QZQ41_18170 [Serratia marcescens]|uniref:hypothetical protein n=1 Tax=Serratia marcescens TaxID=615 RepID=UPI0027550252|nr:hypothetical protein [Serratia marcescens]MDP8612965.1 hypothetical protein [Serratia marcescens]MDP8616461.1 hypothetical protein [Serratia marcescens]MDP8646613.1 hypothetical protein [Serratia marcescens]MDP8656514.1 hypothetical protein [Serratia marcescens]MDP8661498.1 hypothetical protein [Serratia marcescens]
MLSINHPASPEFKIALLRHYIACAFIDSMTSKNGQAVFIDDGEEVMLTLDKVALNIIYHIEAPFIDQFGVMEGGMLAAAGLMAMLAPGFMIACYEGNHLILPERKGIWRKFADLLASPSLGI